MARKKAEEGAVLEVPKTDPSEATPDVKESKPKAAKDQALVDVLKDRVEILTKQVQGFERLQERKLATSHDAALNVCDVCLCPLKLKVHTPLQYIKAHMTDEVFADLARVPGCWIVREMAA